MRHLLLAFCVASCGHDGFDCPLSVKLGGITVCYEQQGVMLDVIEESIKIVEEEVQKRYPDVKDIQKMMSDKNVTIVFTNDMLGTECRPIKASRGGVQLDMDAVTCHISAPGLADPDGSFIIVTYNMLYPCNTYRVFAHEVLHEVEAFYLGSPQEMHSTDYLFASPADKACLPDVTVESIARERVSTYCKEVSGAIK